MIHPTRRLLKSPDAIWAPLIAGLITLVPGLIGLSTGMLVLFPSLGPTAVLQAYTPSHPAARFYNIVVSHLGGLFSAFLAVTLFGLADTPAVVEHEALSVARVGAATLAIVLATGIEWLFNAKHAPAASTTLLAAMGIFRPTLSDTLVVALGVFSVAIVGELFRRARLAALPEEETAAE